MPGNHFPGRTTLARTLARGSAWLTDIFAVVILSFVGQRWSETGGAVAPGIIGTILALLVDSWQTVALSSTPSPSPFPRAEPMKPGATVVCDALSFAVSLGGISSLLVSSVVAGDESGGDGEADCPGAYRKGDTRFGKSSMILVAMWFLGAVVFWRIGLAIWACIDWYKSHHLEPTPDVQEIGSR
ncbi:hypothetical protein E4U43_006169 [Claviceps pusilla]|uniref:Uncharacterized protein n=1 Tax=Claviceps pusilla TaxID=123648 RepID=A0A9P7N3K6_9HYPO|nr:hypothetical protein E4U43_006169 [Claviceps pusilla]